MATTVVGRAQRSTASLSMHSAAGGHNDTMGRCAIDLSERSAPARQWRKLSGCHSCELRGSRVSQEVRRGTTNNISQSCAIHGNRIEMLCWFTSIASISACHLSVIYLLNLTSLMRTIVCLLMSRNPLHSRDRRVRRLELTHAALALTLRTGIVFCTAPSIPRCTIPADHSGAASRHDSTALRSTRFQAPSRWPRLSSIGGLPVCAAPHCAHHAAVSCLSTPLLFHAHSRDAGGSSRIAIEQRRADETKPQQQRQQSRVQQRSTA